MVRAVDMQDVALALQHSSNGNRMNSIPQEKQTQKQSLKKRGSETKQS